MREKSLLIILTGSLGDLVRGLSVACAIKQNESSWHITWLVDSTWQPLIESHPALDDLIVFDRSAPFSNILKLTKKLRKSQFDISLDMQRHLKSGVCSWLAGAKRRVGFNPQNCKELNYLFNNEYIEVQDDTKSKLLHYFAFLDMIHVPRPSVVDFGLKELGLGEANQLVEDSGELLGVILSSSWDSKDWPLDSYRGLVSYIMEKTEFRVVLLGGKKDKAKAEALESLSINDRVINLAGKTSLTALLDVVRQCRLCVGPDSGPGHMAAAVEVPYISLFGPTPPERVAPYKNEGLVLTSTVPCRPCSRRVCPGLNKICMRHITPERVFDKLIEVVPHSAR